MYEFLIGVQVDVQRMDGWMVNPKTQCFQTTAIDSADLYRLSRCVECFLPSLGHSLAYPVYSSNREQIKNLTASHAARAVFEYLLRIIINTRHSGEHWIS